MNKNSGWYEKKQHVVTSRGIQTKAPEHYKASVGKKLEHTLRVPLVSSGWNEAMIIDELQWIIKEMGGFPTDTNLRVMHRSDLANAISKNGGMNYYRMKLGFEVFKADIGYWTEDTIVLELKKVIAEIGHFPTQAELKLIGRGGLIGAISKHGCVNHFRTKLGFKIYRHDNGYWTENTTLAELKIVITDIGHFPTQKELRLLGRNDLKTAIKLNGGMNHFKRTLGYVISRVDAGHWTENTILTELENIIAGTGRFPTKNELHSLGRFDLSVAITRGGGVNYYREKLGYQPLKSDIGYWTEQTIIKELDNIISEIGHFPTHPELNSTGRSGLSAAISKHLGGINYFRGKLGCEIFKVSGGYWTEENICTELKRIITEIGHYPTQDDLSPMGRSDLMHAIYRCGGAPKFRKLLGYPLLLEEYQERNAYITRRGYKSENEVHKLLIQYCKQKEITEPTYNKKLSIGNVIEFVCGGRIGIDVTNTKDPSGWSIKRKYLKKEYHRYLDRLWIVVISDIFTNEDYIKFNIESPPNVEIMSVWDLIDRLQVDIDEHSRRKLEALDTCTFRTKNDLIDMLKNRTLAEFHIQ